MIPEGTWDETLPFGRGAVLSGVGTYRDDMQTQVFTYIENGSASHTFTAARPFLEYLEHQRGYSKTELGPLAAHLFRRLFPFGGQDQPT